MSERAGRPVCVRMVVEMDRQGRVRRGQSGRPQKQAGVRQEEGMQASRVL